MCGSGVMIENFSSVAAAQLEYCTGLGSSEAGQLGAAGMFEAAIALAIRVEATASCMPPLFVAGKLLVRPHPKIHTCVPSLKPVWHAAPLRTIRGQETGCRNL